MIELKPTLPVSRFWDMNQTPEELFSKHDKVYLDLTRKSSKHDDGYTGMRIMIPDGDKNHFTEIGIDSGGFTYEGDVYDYNLTTKSSVYLIETRKAIDAMIHFKNACDNVSSLSSYLTSLHLDHDCCYMCIDAGYTSYKKSFNN